MLDRTLLGSIAFSICICLPPAVTASPPASVSGKIDFDRQIRPILSDRCFTCHGPDEKRRMANLRLDLKDGGAFADRNGTKIIAPGDASHSRLVQRISAEKPALRMPPPSSGLILTADQIKLIRAWIDQGADWKVHWAYVAPERPRIPEVSDPAWARNPIDNFVLARLDREGLKPSPEAGRSTLIRRVTFDLTGLPPTPAEVDAFLNDKSPDAYVKLVDRLLASPRYGERMAVNWLDLARYADTHGYHIDSHREMWHWRDWVINAFNSNMPYNRFTVEQLAGDLLPDATVSQKVASGFNRNHMINFEGGAIPEEYQNEYVVDRVETTAATWLGLTMGCARCHDHKYDPISQKDFYRFYAFFNTVDEEGLDGKRGNAKPFLELPSPDQKSHLEALERLIAEREKKLAEENVAPEERKWETERLATLPPTPRDGVVAWYELDGNLTDITGRYRNGRIVKGDPVYRSGVIGNGAEFDGQTHVSFGPAVFDFNKPFSIGTWIDCSGARKNPVLTELSAAGRGFELYLDDYVLTEIQQRSPRLFARIGGTGDQIAISGKERLIAGRWYHVALRYDGSGKASGLQLFVNGKRIASDVLENTLASPVDSSSPLEIGNAAFGPRFRGRLDDLRIYSRALDPAEIETLGVYDPIRFVMERPRAGRTSEQNVRLREYYLENGAAPELRQAWAGLKADKSEKKQLVASIPTTMVMSEMAQPRETAVLGRGDYRNRGEVVTPGVPGVLPPLRKEASANRLTLAQWLTSPTHPLTSRVAVNRFWQLYFGTGIVKTAQDFGSQGDPPSHPELLDWLATEFIRTGWDVRAMQRLIVTSATYRQSSRTTAELTEKDPENRLLARGPRFRLAAEMVRDNALYVSGLLKERVGGPSVFPYQPSGLWEEVSFGDGFSAQSYAPSHGDDLYRRSMYTFWKRTSPPPSLTTFDAPGREKCTALRSVTNTPLQALVLLNDPTYIESARQLAARSLSEAPRDTAHRIEWMFRLATARKPTQQEKRLLESLASAQMAAYKTHPDEAAKLLSVGETPANSNLRPVELAAWTTVASTILNLDETVTKE